MAQNKGIRDFRHAISVLKRKGVIRADIDARSVKPTPALEKSIKKFGRLLTGEAVAVRLSPKETTKKKAQGFKIAQAKGQPRKVIVPVASGDRVSVSHGKLVTRFKSGLHAVDIEPEVSSTTELERWIEENKRRINRMKSKGQYFGFKLNGYSSTKIYTNIQLLFDDLLAYEIFTDYAEQGPKEMRNAIDSIQIVSIESKSDWQFGGHLKKIKTPGRQKYARRKAKLKRSPEAVKEQHREERAEIARAYRESLKKDPARLAAYKDGAKKRAEKSRNKKGK